MDDLQFFEKLQNRHTLIQKDKEGDHILEKLNILIHGDKQTQRYAICILNSVLKNCAHEVFEENATAWMRFVLQTINRIPSDNLLNLCYITLTHLLEYASDIDKVARDIATKGIDPLLTLLVGTSLPTSTEKINMIKCCVITFPGPCGQHQSTILKLVVSVIESDEYLDCLAACKMFALLPTCGSAGESKNKYADNWISQFYQVVNTTHFYISKVINKVSSGVDDKLIDKQDNSKLIPFSEITEGLEVDVIKASARIERLLLMLQHLVGTAMSFEIQFPILKLINLFCEVSNLLHVELNDLVGFELVLIKISESLLKCIFVSIKQFKTMLIPFLQQIMMILSSTISSSCIRNRTYAYQCILSIMKHWKVLPTFLNVIDNIFVSIFRDIKIPDDISLAEEGTCNKQDKKDNHTHTLAHDINEQSKKEIKRFNYVACKNAHVALTVLEKVLISSGPVLTVENLNSIITNILNTFVKLYGSEGFCPPYSYDDNRLMIFKVAKRLLMLFHGSVHIPVSILLSFFHAGTTELHDGIRCYCHGVLLEYDCIIHPLSHGFYDNKHAHRDLNANYSMKLDEDIKYIKKEEVSYLTSGGAVVPLNNKDDAAMLQSTHQPMRLCSSADQVLGKEAASAILPPTESSLIHQPMRLCSSADLDLGKESPSVILLTSESFSNHQPMRLCSSADQVLVKEAVPNVLPTRASSEPFIHQNNALAVKRNYSSGVPTLYEPSNKSYTPISNDCNEGETNENIYVEDNAKIEDEEYDDGPVIISDNSSEEDITSYVPQQYQAAPPANGNGSINIDPPCHETLESMYSPRSKKLKLNSGGYENEGDKEYIDILDTFCEIDADD